MVPNHDWNCQNLKTYRCSTKADDMLNERLDAPQPSKIMGFEMIAHVFLHLLFSASRQSLCEKSKI